MNKIKILLISPGNKGTISLCSLNLWNALKQDANLDIKCVIKHKLKNGFLEFNNCEYYSNSEPKGGLKNLSSLMGQIIWFKKIKKKFKPHITISTLDSCSALNIISGGKDIKIGIFHSPHYQQKVLGRITYLYNLFYYKFLFPKLNKLVCVSKEIEESIKLNFPRIQKNKITTIYNAHNISNIIIKSQEEITNFSEKNIFNKNTFVYIGRLDKNKAPDRLIKAFKIAYLKNDVNLVFIGSGEYNYIKELKSLVDKLNLNNKIFFLGEKRNPYKYLVKSSALISSSFSEGLPGVLIEAMILRIPIISTNSSKGVWEILDCEDKYNFNLKSPLINDYGIITSNLQQNENLNINNLALSLSCFAKYQFNKGKPSSIVEKVSYDKIKEQFIELFGNLKKNENQ